jgi:hypothetical protein
MAGRFMSMKPMTLSGIEPAVPQPTALPRSPVVVVVVVVVVLKPSVVPIACLGICPAGDVTAGSKKKDKACHVRTGLSIRRPRGFGKRASCP